METEEQENKHPHVTANSERRKHPRFSVDLQAEYYKLGSIVKHEGKAVNASQGGLLLHFSELLPIGLYLRLKVLLPSGSKLSGIETIAEVAWTDIRWEEGEGDCRTGVRFFEASPKDMRKLKKYLRALSQ